MSTVGLFPRRDDNHIAFTDIAKNLKIVWIITELKHIIITILAAAKVFQTEFKPIPDNFKNGKPVFPSGVFGFIMKFDNITSENRFSLFVLAIRGNLRIRFGIVYRKSFGCIIPNTILR